MVNTKHIPALDGYRGLAILLVMCYHFGGLLPWGWVGVDLFFVLSGFLITGILAGSSRPMSGRKLLRFYRNRILRIVPAYYLVLFAFFVLPVLFFPDKLTVAYNALRADQAAYWFFNVDAVDAVNGWPAMIYLIQCWSLSVEMKFYLIWPLVWWFYRRKSDMRGWIILMLGIALAAFWFRVYGSQYFSLRPVYRYCFFVSRLDSFALGGIGFLLYDRYGLKPFRQTLRFLLAGVVLILGAVYVLGYWNAGLQDPFTGIWGTSLLALGALALMLLGLEDSGWLNRFFSATLLRQTGKYSYSLYLLHNPVWLVLAQSGLPGWAAIVLAFLISFVLSYASYILIERKFMELKQKM